MAVRSAPHQRAGEAAAVSHAALRVEFQNQSGQVLSGRLEQPEGRPVAWAVFAHCFTGTKNLRAISRIVEPLVARGVAVLRFDFTGLGSSEGEFADTTFSHNVADLVAAASHLEGSHGVPSLLIGHSLGGTAALHAAALLPAVSAVATIGAPAHAAHVARLLRSSVPQIEATGEAKVNLGGRTFTIRREFLLDLERHATLDVVRELRGALLVMHSPVDSTVDVENASEIFRAAWHPKSFVSLDRADHLLSSEQDAAYAGSVLAAWAQKYVVVAT